MDRSKRAFPVEVFRSVRPKVGLAAKIPILIALRLLRYAWDFETGHRVTKRLLIAAEPSGPAIILRDESAADKTLANLMKLAIVPQQRLCIAHVFYFQDGAAVHSQLLKLNKRIRSQAPASA